MHLLQYRPSRNPRSWAITNTLLMALLLLVSTPVAAPAQSGAASVFVKFVKSVMVEITANQAGEAVLGTMNWLSKDDWKNWASKWLKRTPPGYRFVLSWEVEEGTYFGTLKMRDTTGTFTVRTPDRVTLNQDMTARRRWDGLWLVGSNLTWAPNSEQPKDYQYNPDEFHVVKQGDYEWTIDDVCDAERCANVEVLEASTF
jgi:hypothetical protein